MLQLLFPLTAALIGGGIGYATAGEDENKGIAALKGAALLGTGVGVGGLGVKAAASGLSKLSSLRSLGTGTLSALKSAYSGGSGLVNLAMDAMPIISDASTGNLGIHSFSGIGGTLIGTKFGRRELNKAGEDLLRKKERLATAEYVYRSADNRQQLGLPSARANRAPQYGQTGTFVERNPDANRFVDDRVSELRDEYLKDPRYSRQGYNMPVGFAADYGLGSAAYAMSQPKFQDPNRPTPVSQYIQLLNEY